MPFSFNKNEHLFMLRLHIFHISRYKIFWIFKIYQSLVNLDLNKVRNQQNVERWQIWVKLKLRKNSDWTMRDHSELWLVTEISHLWQTLRMYAITIVTQRAVIRWLNQVTKLSQSKLWITPGYNFKAILNVLSW